MLYVHLYLTRINDSGSMLYGFYAKRWFKIWLTFSVLKTLYSYYHI
jgi:hypothetical protein